MTSTTDQRRRERAGMSEREVVARALFERGRTIHDAESWEAADDETRQWVLGHADAVLAALSAYRGKL